MSLFNVFLASSAEVFQEYRLTSVFVKLPVYLTFFFDFLKITTPHSGHALNEQEVYH